jgi:dolichyl-phosphate-mannose--protein O-mannosyl transferase
VTVPIVGVLAWTEKNKGYALIVIAYFLQWLPWIGSPRIAFEYHFYPNLAMIVLANAIVLQRLWQLGCERMGTTAFPRLPISSADWRRWSVLLYLLAVVLLFVYFYPILAAVHIPKDQWDARIWLKPGNNPFNASWI